MLLSELVEYGVGMALAMNFTDLINVSVNEVLHTELRAFV